MTKLIEFQACLSPCLILPSPSPPRIWRAAGVPTIQTDVVTPQTRCLRRPPLLITQQRPTRQTPMGDGSLFPGAHLLRRPMLALQGVEAENEHQEHGCVFAA